MQTVRVPVAPQHAWQRSAGGAVLGLLAVVVLGLAGLAQAQDQVDDQGQYQSPDQAAYGAAPVDPGYDTQGEAQPASDPPARAARLAYMSGAVSFAPPGEEQWALASLNRPLAIGDRLYTDRDARAELELGDASIRLDEQTAFSFLNLDDNNAQVQLSNGTLNLGLRNVYSGQSYEIDTPTVAFVVNQPGEYRVDVDPNGGYTNVAVYNGAGTIYGEGGVSYPVAAGQFYRFFNSQLSGVASGPLPRTDDFDQWCFQRDARFNRVVQQGYVSPGVVGAEDLDDYGAWQSVPEYGNVWFPATVAVADWAPYRYGHWAWIDPWGWTWVDDAPWGFAPFHYGRWVYVGTRWGWMPGPVVARPVYSPALVAFIGLGGGVSIGFGAGGPVGWIPLGPRDVYCPPYRVSRRYFTNVNVTNVTNVYVNRTVINNYYTNVVVNKRVNNVNYTYRSEPRAATVVSHDAFVGARPVAASRERFDQDKFSRAPMSLGAPALPTRESQALRPGGHAAPAAVFQRPITARTAPPPRPPPFAARQAVIQRSGGAPVSLPQMRRLAGAAAAGTPVNVIGQPRAVTRLPGAAAPSGDFPPRPGAQGRPEPAPVQRGGAGPETPAPQRRDQGGFVQAPQRVTPPPEQHQPLNIYTPPRPQQQVRPEPQQRQPQLERINPPPQYRAPPLPQEQTQQPRFTEPPVQRIEPQPQFRPEPQVQPMPQQQLPPPQRQPPPQPQPPPQQPPPMPHQGFTTPPTHAPPPASARPAPDRKDNGPNR